MMTAQESEADIGQLKANHEEALGALGMLLMTAAAPGINEWGGKEFRIAKEKARAVLAKAKIK